MEIDWRILSLTVWLVIAVAVAGIVRFSFEKGPGLRDRWRRASSPTSSSAPEWSRVAVRLPDVAPHLALLRSLLQEWYEHARRPVFPLSARE